MGQSCKEWRSAVCGQRREIESGWRAMGWKACGQARKRRRHTPIGTRGPGEGTPSAGGLEADPEGAVKY